MPLACFRSTNGLRRGQRSTPGGTMRAYCASGVYRNGAAGGDAPNARTLMAPSSSAIRRSTSQRWSFRSSESDLFHKPVVKPGISSLRTSVPQDHCPTDFSPARLIAGGVFLSVSQGHVRQCAARVVRQRRRTGLISISVLLAEALTPLFILGLFWPPFSRLPRNSGRPPLLELSLQVEREGTHNSNSGVVAPGLKSLTREALQRSSPPSQRGRARAGSVQ